MNVFSDKMKQIYVYLTTLVTRVRVHDNSFLTSVCHATTRCNFPTFLDTSLLFYVTGHHFTEVSHSVNIFHHSFNALFSYNSFLNKSINKAPSHVSLCVIDALMPCHVNGDDDSSAQLWLIISGI